MVLCSVDDPKAALKEIKRLLNKKGGTFAYIEHIGVKMKKDNNLSLAIQQKVLDPFQQEFAHNCHLRRNTDEMISDIFQLQEQSHGAKLVTSERFIVDDMWPCSLQSSGVIQLL